jgi:low affinity Fe/Cu permease
MRPKDSGTTPGKRPASRVLHALDTVASTSAVALTVAVLAVVWVVLSVWLGFPSRLERIFQTLVAALTLAMVFVIQHTQSRQQEATQRKLDEILRGVPEADNAVISLEHAPDEELRAVSRKHRDAGADSRGHGSEGSSG